eukprot:3003591-Amphidinium_carterae.1
MPRVKTRDVADAATLQSSFADLSLTEPLLRSLSEMGCEHPSPVQLKTIPLALAGDDVIVQAKSGTGKTIAFCSVMLHVINTSVKATQGLVLTPTREIAQQVADELRRLAWYVTPRLSVACFIGGVPLHEDEERITESLPHIAVATPGRASKLLRDAILETEMRIMVLDEADKLLDGHFRDDITTITELVWTEALQFMAVSATFLPPLITAAETLFVHVEKKRSKRGQPVTRPLPKMVQLCTSVTKKDETGKNVTEQESEPDGAQETAVLRGVLHLRYLLQHGYHVRQKLPALVEILTTSTYQQAIVFVNAADRATQ